MKTISFPQLYEDKKTQMFAQNFKRQRDKRAYSRNRNSLKGQVSRKFYFKWHIF